MHMHMYSNFFSKSESSFLERRFVTCQEWLSGEHAGLGVSHRFETGVWVSAAGDSGALGIICTGGFSEGISSLVISAKG